MNNYKMSSAELATAASVLRDELVSVSTFVLAGGRGERLYPLTKDRAKPAVVFGGIYRIIDFTLSNCVNSGIRRINVLTQYKSFSLARHIKLGWNILPSELTEFIEVIPAQQRYGESWYRGTADAIYQNIYTIERERPARVLILGGDHVYRMDYLRMLQSHVEAGADMTIGAFKVPKEESKHFGVLEVDSAGSVKSFVEKPLQEPPFGEHPDSVLASMGFYLFETNVLLEELFDAQKAEGKYDFGRDILPKMVKSRKINAFVTPQEDGGWKPYWRDIGTLDAYYRANMDLVSVEPQFNLYDEDWPIRTHQRQFPPAKTVHFYESEGSRRGEAFQSLISSGCIISGGSVLRTILSPRVRIHSYATVEDSILMDGVVIGERVQIRKAIIDKEVEFLPGTRIGYDLEEDRKRFHVTEEGVVVIPKGRVIGPDQDEPKWGGFLDNSG
jgi:glucose-1-phosphate adenylyltransferase